MTTSDVVDASGYDLGELPPAGFIGLVRVPAGGGTARRALVGVIEQAQAALADAGSGWTLAVETGTHPFVIPVQVSYQRPPATQAFPTPANLLGFLHDLPEPVRLVLDVMLVPAPGHKPGAGSTRLRHHALTRGDRDRVPVAVVARRPPPRRSREELDGHPRPVVALIDTRVEAHDWLGEPDPDPGGDGFWADAATLGWDPGPRLAPPPPRDRPELGEHEGHGTFSAGLVRQVAPDVRLLAVHAMADDGDAHGDHVLNALAWIESAAALRQGDVVCLPAGFRPEVPTDVTYLGWLGEVLAALAARGIAVVAAAGNDGSDVPSYPAAFAVASGGPVGGARHVSVGALNPDGTTSAYYSNHGDWVTAREIGTSVVSTFPRVDRAAAPQLAVDGRRTADPDDFTGGFARWSGTSFAAAIHAGGLAQRRIDEAIGAHRPVRAP